MVHIPDNTLNPIPQSVWNYRSLDTSSDPSICIDNGELIASLYLPKL